MSTNYYAKHPVTGENIHLGKRFSSGFIIHGREGVSSAETLVKLVTITGGKAYSEHGEQFSAEEFSSMIEGYRNPEKVQEWLEKHKTCPFSDILNITVTSSEDGDYQVTYSPEEWC